ncbi:MAG: transglycosylase SLT domain-containing protein [Hyphomicrobium sp.]|jgi:soluble lytic murein transglycosylase-like protein
MRRLLIALASAFIFSGQSAELAAETNACERELVRAAASHNVPLGMLYAVGLSESGRGGSLQPYALNIDGRPAYEPSKPAALRAFRQAKLDGAKLIDVGCMQINHYYHGERFASLEDMFDPAKNVEYAARFLSELKEREGTWTKAIARYHAGPNNAPAQKSYVCRVIGNMIGAGFGEWTSDARSYCGR